MSPGMKWGGRLIGFAGLVYLALAVELGGRWAQGLPFVAALVVALLIGGEGWARRKARRTSAMSGDARRG